MDQAGFCRVEVFARSRAKLARTHVATSHEVIAEIAREPGFREHVDDLVRPGDKPAPGPRPPVVVWGCDPGEVPDLIETEIARRKDRGERAPRRDTPVLAGYVVSTPISPARFARDPAAAAWTKRLLRASLRHLRDEAAARGGRVVSAVVHLDESRVHMHVLALPSHTPDYSANRLHPGRAAHRAARAAGQDAVRASRAASAALAAFVDTYHARVAAPFGLLRRCLPRARRRLPRAALAIARHAEAAPSAASPEAVDAAVPVADPSRGRGWRLDDFVAGAEAMLGRLGAGPGPARDPRPARDPACAGHDRSGSPAPPVP